MSFILKVIFPVDILKVGLTIIPSQVFDIRIYPFRLEILQMYIDRVLNISMLIIGTLWERLKNSDEISSWKQNKKSRSWFLALSVIHREMNGAFSSPMSLITLHVCLLLICSALHSFILWSFVEFIYSILIMIGDTILIIFISVATALLGEGEFDWIMNKRKSLMFNE
jgi:hypothetical protein